MFSVSWFVGTRRLRGVRAWSAAVFACAAIAMAVSVRREVGFHMGGGWFVSVGNGCGLVGFRDLSMNWNAWRGRGGAGNERGFYTRDTWYTEWALAWRPFHAKDVYSPRQGAAGAAWDYIVVPLWPLVFASLAACAWSSGVLAGVRRVRSKSCLSCGYDLSKTVAAEGVRVCPECGVGNGVGE